MPGWTELPAGISIDEVRVSLGLTGTTPDVVLVARKQGDTGPIVRAVQKPGMLVADAGAWNTATGDVTDALTITPPAP
jgi:hypothetical protein